VGGGLGGESLGVGLTDFVYPSSLARPSQRIQRKKTEIEAADEETE